MLNDIELLELLSAKICHDLSGPVGAVSNGLDLMEDADEEMKKKAVDLIDECAHQAIGRINLFRKLYGVNVDTNQANLVEIKSLLDHYLMDNKITIDWPVEDLFISYYVIDNRIGKLIIAVIVAGASFLIQGGVISIKFNQLVTGCELIITLKPRKTIKIDQTSLDILHHDIPKSNLDTKNVQFYLVKRLISALPATITILQEPFGFVVNFH
jgi:histidine phosphotransferase ChpT